MPPVRPLHRAALGALLTLLFATPARAEVDLGSLDIFVQDSPTSPVPKGLVLGGAVIGGDARYQGQDDTALAVPGAVYFGDQFMFLGDRARYYFHKDDNFAAYGYGRVRFGNLDPDDAPNSRAWSSASGSWKGASAPASSPPTPCSAPASART